MKILAKFTSLIRRIPRIMYFRVLSIAQGEKNILIRRIYSYIFVVLCLALNNKRNRKLVLKNELRISGACNGSLTVRKILWKFNFENKKAEKRRGSITKCRMSC